MANSNPNHRWTGSFSPLARHGALFAGLLYLSGCTSDPHEDSLFWSEAGSQQRLAAKRGAAEQEAGTVRRLEGENRQLHQDAERQRQSVASLQQKIAELEDEIARIPPAPDVDPTEIQRMKDEAARIAAEIQRLQEDTARGEALGAKRDAIKAQIAALHRRVQLLLK